MPFVKRALLDLYGYDVGDVSYVGCISDLLDLPYRMGAMILMEKRGSRYLRYALFNATQYVCIWDPTYKAYLEKKRSEGKHYFVAISHAAKKLVRLIYHLQTTGEAYCPTA